MRKRLKRKRRSCAMCKPHKMGGAARWKSREEQRLKEFEGSSRSGAREQIEASW